MKYLFKLFIIITLFAAHAFAQWSNDPSINTQVSSFPSNTFNPQTVVDGNGGAIVLWQTFSGLYIQKISPLGIKQWNANGVLICNQFVSSPQIIADGTGGAFICWVDSRDGNDDIYLQRIDNNGNILWIANGIAVCNDLEYQDSPVMCSDGVGGVYIAWHDQRNFNSDIYAQRIDSSGITQWTSNGIPVCDETSQQTSPQIASDGNGNTIIVWTDNRNSFSTDDDIYAQKVDSNGTALWSDDGESVSSANNIQSEARIINNGVDEVIVAWIDERNSNKDIYAQKIITNNNYLQTEWDYDGLSICSDISDQSDVELVSNVNNGIIFCWVDARNGTMNTDIFAQRVNSLGQIIWITNGVAISTASNDQFDQQIVSDGYSGAIITWTDRRISSTSSDIYSQRIDGDGNLLWNSNGIILANAANEQLEPSLLMLNPNNFLIVFNDKRNAGDIYCQKFYIDGTLPAVVPASVDGVISPNEYGGIEGTYLTSEGKTWYMKMDETYIYVGISNYANTSDAVNIYLGNRRIRPVNKIDDGIGSIVGTGLDGITPNLPFAATYYVNLKPSSDEYKYFTESGGWGQSCVNGVIKSYSPVNNVIEFVIPWSSLPDIELYARYGMNWLGFLSNLGTSSSRVPIENPSGSTPDMSWYFDTGYASFGGGIPSLPFSNKSFTHVGNDVLNFGSLTVLDFTLNSPGKQFIRTSGNWVVTGALGVYDGTLIFNSNDTVDVNLLDHGGGKIKFSSGTFNAPLNVRAIDKYGLADSLVMNSGQITTFYGSSNYFRNEVTNDTVQFQNVIIISDSLDLYSDMTINESLALNPGEVQTNGYKLILKNGASVTGPGFINGAVEIAIPPSPNALPKGNGIENYQVTFPVGTENGSSPVTLDFASVTTGGNVTVQAFQSVHPNSVIQNQSAQRYWSITKDNDLAFTSANVTFNYRPEDFNTAFFEATDEAAMVVGKYDTGNWTFPTILSRSVGGNNDGGSVTVSGITSFSDFTFAKNESALPVELTSFTASVRNNSVLLNWTTATELNNFGFEIERMVQTSTPYSLNKWERIGFIAGSGNSNSPKEYSFTDGSLNGGSKFKYRLKQIDNDGTFSYSDEINVEVIPTKFELSQNFPNPFNPSTTISFSIPNEELVSLKVYNSLGEEVVELINETKQAGNYEINFNASGLSSGIYFYKIQAGSFTQTKKMTILK